MVHDLNDNVNQSSLKILLNKISIFFNSKLGFKNSLFLIEFKL